MRRTIYNSAIAAQSLAPTARTATANGASVDMGEFRSALLIVDAGTITDGTHTVSLQESADNTTFTAVAARDLQGSIPALTAANDLALYELGYVGSKRYLRATVTVAGATTGGVIGCVIQRTGDEQPVTRP